jgi:hypothetical protein
MEEDEKKDPKNIEILNGNGEGLEISPLYDHISIENPTEDANNEEVIIPENLDQEDDENSDDTNNNDNNE